MKILIIEDEKKLAQALKESLYNHGFIVDYITNGKDGQRRVELHSDDYDLLLLDLTLPGIDGLTILRNIRRKNITIPVLILTGEDSTEKIVNGLNSGADDYLVKPFSHKELVARINALLRRPKQSMPVELKIKDLTLNRTTQEVMRSGKKIPLTLKEFGVLEYLMRRPNQAISREDIFSNIWDFASNSFSNVVDVHIKNLRKKIDSGFEEKLLETVHGIGYQIKA